MDYNKSLEELEKTLQHLREDNNKKIPIIVEGDKDKEALHTLEIKGKIICVNRGISIIDFCDELAKKYHEIIILTDWDRHGGYLCQKIKKNLEGRVNCNTKYRQLFAKNTTVRTVEGFPSWLETIRNKLNIN